MPSLASTSYISAASLGLSSAFLLSKLVSHAQDLNSVSIANLSPSRSLYVSLCATLISVETTDQVNTMMIYAPCSTILIYLSPVNNTVLQCFTLVPLLIAFPLVQVCPPRKYPSTHSCSPMALPCTQVCTTTWYACPLRHQVIQRYRKEWRTPSSL